MGRSLEQKKIKSAHRVLEVLEFFNVHRGEATVMGIARAMNYPQSSTSELLGYLVALGYLHHDPYARTYRPSARVALLGAWVQPKLFRQGKLLPMMDELADEAKACVILGSKVGTAVQLIHVVASAGNEQSALIEGTSVPLLRSAVGKILLSTYDREFVRKLIHRLNAEVEDRASHISTKDFIAELDLIRAQGYALNLDDFGGALICALLPPTSSNASAGDQIAIGLLTQRETLEHNEHAFLRMLRNAVARAIGPVRVPPSSQFQALRSKRHVFA